MFFFFFKQKTAYEIYQCDWSSDVCSSDLSRREPQLPGVVHEPDRDHPGEPGAVDRAETEEVAALLEKLVKFVGRQPGHGASVGLGGPVGTPGSCPVRLPCGDGCNR